MTRAITAKEFTNAMARLGPFEKHPRIAFGLSGGGDSLALGLLLRDWVKEREGHLVALIVDHKLRDNSTREAGEVGRWMENLGIEHKILTWHHDGITSRIQIRAREARYALFEEWCKNHAFFHLALAHHMDDQIETFLFRLLRGSTPMGLAGMSGERMGGHMRIVRPLLSFPKACLLAYLQKGGQNWIEDPSNENSKFGRIQVRRLHKDLKSYRYAKDEALFGAVQAFGKIRQGMENHLATALAQTTCLYPEGFADIARAQFSGYPQALRILMLTRILQVVGGRRYAPAPQQVEALAHKLAQPGMKVNSLGGCLVSFMPDLKSRTPNVDVKQTIRVYRERNTIEPMQWKEDGQLWDGRFFLKGKLESEGVAYIDAMREKNWQHLVEHAPYVREVNLPFEVKLTLPAIWDDKGLLGVPNLGYYRNPVLLHDLSCNFRPRHKLTSLPFLVA